MLSRHCYRSSLLHNTRPSRPTSSSTKRLIRLTPTTLTSIPTRSSPPHTFKSQPFSIRSFHTSPAPLKGLQPDTENPKPPTPESDIAGGASHNASAASITPEEYHELSDAFIEDLQVRLEELAENPEKGIEVEYSAGVLTLTTPLGVYVLNKQPPNRQIWLSSPISGPKRYDWVVMGESQHQKQGTGEGPVGNWVYLRDGSTLPGLLRKEVGVDLDGDREDGEDGGAVGGGVGV